MGKGLVYGNVLIFGTFGAYIPAIWTKSIFTVISVVGLLTGACIGIWLAVKINDYLDL